jgi:hypothetical protein
MEYRELSLNIAKEFSRLLSIFMKVEEIQTILNNLRRHLTVFPSDFNNIYLKYFGILQNLTRNYEILQKFTKVYESLRKFTKVTIFHDIFSVKSLPFVPFGSLAMYFLHFVILYGDKLNFPVCYHSVSPLDNISKYFAIIKR